MSRSFWARDIGYKLLAFLGAAYMLSLLLDWPRCWQSFDLPLRYYPQIIRDDFRLVPGDLVRIFDPGPFGCHFGPPARFRYVQDFFSILDVKFRIWLFNYLPPHPSVSLTWLLVLLVNPLLMYQLAYSLTGSRPAAWSGAILFALSTGNLSGITMADNPAKQLVNFFGLAVFYLASRVEALSGPEGELSPSARFRWYLLLLALLVSFFTDETAWLFYVVLPLIFPAIFLRPRSRRLVLATYPFLLLLAVFLIVAVFPALQARYASGEVAPETVVSWLAHPDAGPLLPPLFGFRTILLTARNLFWTRLAPWGHPWWACVSLPLLAAFVFQRFRRLGAPRRGLALRCLLALAVFLVFQSLGIAKAYWEEGFIVKYPCYYGAMFSLFFSLPFALLFSNPVSLRGRLADLAALVWLSGVLAFNFPRINHDVRYLQAAWENAGELDFAAAREAWRRRDDPAAIAEFKARYPRRSPWLYIREMKAVAQQRAAERIRSAPPAPERPGGGAG